MTKERLKEYRHLKIEEEQLERQLLEHMDKSLVGGARLTGLPKGGEIADTTAQLAVESVEMYAMLLAKRLEIAGMRKEIEEWIEGLEDSCERVLMRSRHIEGKSWEDICVIMGYSRRNILYLHSKILKSLHTIAH